MLNLYKMKMFLHQASIFFCFNGTLPKRPTTQKLPTLTASSTGVNRCNSHLLSLIPYYFPFLSYPFTIVHTHWLHFVCTPLELCSHLTNLLTPITTNPNFKRHLTKNPKRYRKHVKNISLSLFHFTINNSLSWSHIHVTQETREAHYILIFQNF